MGTLPRSHGLSPLSAAAAHQRPTARSGAFPPPLFFLCLCRRGAAAQLPACGGARGSLQSSGITAPQRQGEPAWHRRARRLRGEARAWLRVAAAGQRLAAHHSAQRASRAAPAMPQRGGRASRDAGGEGSTLAAKVDELRQMVIELRNGGASAPGRGATPAGATGGGERRGSGPGGVSRGGNARSRPGDWVCSSCGAAPCFARTVTCYRCGAARPGGDGRNPSATAARAGGGLSDMPNSRSYLGPVGAGGSRPLLGRRGQPAATTAPAGQPRSADRCPTVRVPNASAAARAESERLGGAGPGGPRRDAGGQRGNVDGDGFQQVHGGAASGGRSGRPAMGLGGGPLGQRAPAATRNSWAALLDEELEGGGQDQEMATEENDDDLAANEGDDGGGDSAHHDHDHGHGEDDVEGGEEGGEEGDAMAQLDEFELKRMWQALGNSVRLLERDPQSPPCLVAEARARRDAAEERWRAAKKPHPLSKRLKWAEADLRDAESKERQHRLELQQHLEQTARRTRELEERVSVDAARTQRRRAAVEALYAEGAQRPGWAAGSAARVAATGIATDVAPALLAAIERLAHQGGDTETIRQELQLVAVSLNRVEGVLRDATDQQPQADDGPERFDISDDANGGGRGGGGGAQGGARPAGDTSDPAGRPPRPAAASVPRWSKPSPNEPWRKSAPTVSSAGAAEEARRLLLSSTSSGALGAGAGAAGGDGGAPGPGADDGSRADDGRRLQQQMDEQRRQQEEEEMRARRVQQQQEELLRHQAALQQAAEARAAEETRQREALIASMSPQELARAAELHAQQAAVGSQVFGTQAAGHLASMVQQAHVGGPAVGATETSERADVDHLMSLSPEELARWDQDCQGMGGL